MKLRYKDKEYKIIRNIGANNNSYINHDKKIIYIRRDFDLYHEIMHLILNELKLKHNEEEFLVTFISENFENLLLDNLDEEYIYIMLNSEKE